MDAFTDPRPQAPHPSVPRVDQAGRPTTAWVKYETDLAIWEAKRQAWMNALAAAIP